MTVIQDGSVNLAALGSPKAIVQIIPPDAAITGVPTYLLGLVGVASWGIVNAVTLVGGGGMKDFISKFGGLREDKHALYTGVQAAQLVGTQAFQCVRVSDGTDLAATATIQTSLTLTGRCTGTAGNTIVATVSAGNKANTWQVSIAMAGFTPEVFQNIGGTGATFWTNVANAINQGSYGTSASKLVVASASGSTTPVAGTYTLSGGTDGASGVTDATLLGTDGVTRTGMYALRNSGVFNFVLLDVTDPTTYANQNAFAESISAENFVSGGLGELLATAITTKATAGIDSYFTTYVLGDGITFYNGQSNITVQPTVFLAALRSLLSPEQSVLNKPIGGIITTQRVAAGLPYSDAEVDQAFQNGIEIITNPIPAGNMYGARCGVTTSSNPTNKGDNYAAMTNFLGVSINNAIGPYIGKLNNPTTRAIAKSALEVFLQGLEDKGMIGAPDGSTPYQVILGSSNNSNAQAALGYMYAQVKVVYQSIIWYFIVDLQGGQGVTISQTPLAA